MCLWVGIPVGSIRQSQYTINNIIIRFIIVSGACVCFHNVDRNTATREWVSTHHLPVSISDIQISIFERITANLIIIIIPQNYEIRMRGHR